MNSAFYLLGALLDLEFLTPFGYYLQCIQPLYTTLFRLDEYVDQLLEQYAVDGDPELVLFSPCTSYDLTPLGEQILLKGEKSNRKQVLSAKENDSKLFAMILASRAYSGMVGFPGEEDEKPARRRKKPAPRSSKPRKIQCEDCEDGMVTMTCTDHVMHICESCSEKHEDCMTIELE
jgi:hypothetical protein